MRLADFNGDGYPDVVAGTNYNPLSDESVHGRRGDSVWFNDGSGVMVDSGQTLSSGETLGVALGDFDGDNDLDLVAIDWNRSASHSVWWNNGRGLVIRDRDNDGVEDAIDRCDNTRGGDIVLPRNGCSVQQICVRSEVRSSKRFNRRKRGRSLRCVFRVSRSFVRAGVMTRWERRALIINRFHRARRWR